MREQWNELNKVGAQKIQDSALNQANLIQYISENQQTLVDSFRDDLNNQFKSTLADVMMIFQQYDGTQDVESTQSGSANSMASALTMDRLMSTIKYLQN